MKKIILTGGGTAGHVTPNIALIPHLKAKGYEISYIGSYNGIEKQLIEEIKIPYYGIASGKLRRYLDVKNFTDPFKVLKGYFEALQLIQRLKPSVIFSKGGFVTVPVVLAAKTKGIPIIIHESDITPGLANKISIPLARYVCATFPETMKHLPKDKGILTGTPIREALFRGSREKGLKLCGFTSSMPVLLIIGGSLGSVKINEMIRKIVPSLLKKYQIIHICGKGHIDPSYNHLTGYNQYEYVNEELPHFLTAADLVISRAGANSLSELLALKKPNILIPLSASASRGDQILNAKSFESQGFSYVLEEADLNATSLTQALHQVYSKRQAYVEKMSKSQLQNGVEKHTFIDYESKLMVSHS